MKNQYRETIAGLNELVERGIVPGISYALFDHGTEYREVKGYAEIQPKREPLKARMQYDLRSRTVQALQVGILYAGRDNPGRHGIYACHRNGPAERNSSGET